MFDVHFIVIISIITTIILFIFFICYRLRQFELDLTFRVANFLRLTYRITHALCANIEWLFLQFSLHRRLLLVKTGFGVMVIIYIFMWRETDKRLYGKSANEILVFQ